MLVPSRPLPASTSELSGSVSISQPSVPSLFSFSAALAGQAPGPTRILGPSRLELTTTGSSAPVAFFIYRDSSSAANRSSAAARAPITIVAFGPEPPTSVIGRAAQTTAKAALRSNDRRIKVSRSKGPLASVLTQVRQDR